MYASVLLTPCDCCSGPRDVRIIGCATVPSRCAISTSMRLGHAGQLLDLLGPVDRGDLPDLLEAVRAVADVRLVDQTVADEHVEQAVGERGVGAGPDRQMPIGPRGRRRPPRIDRR